MMDKKYTVLVIEDEKLLLNAICRKLEASGLSAISCETGADALRLLEGVKKLPDAIWLDYYLSDMNGLEFMNTLKKK